MRVDRSVDMIATIKFFNKMARNDVQFAGGKGHWGSNRASCKRT